MAVRLLLDENIPPRIAARLVESGYDVVHVRDIGYKGCADSELLEFAIRDCRCLVTMDADFADIRHYPLGSHKGIIRLRLKLTTSDTVTEALLSLLPKLADVALETGVLVLSSEDSYRIRIP